MKVFNYLPLFLIGFALFLVSCQGGDSDVRDKARQSLPQSTETTTAPAPTTNPAASVNSNEPHYKCPNNCQGGVGAASGACPVCGTQMAHNQAYHNQTATPATQPQIQPQTQPQTPSPAQNAAGVYHYTCSNGCAGGSGSQGTCASCGAALAHNQAYHNN